MIALRRLAREARVVKWDQFEWAGAARCTIGVVVPLLVGVTTGGVADGVAAAVGALGAGFGSFQGTYRSRLATTLVLSSGMAIAALIGALATRSDPATIVVVALFGLLAGMMAALGQAALVVGLQWVVAVVVIAAIPMTVGQAVVRSGFVLAGGVLQAVLLVVAWPLRPHAVERRALAGVMRELAVAAGQMSTGQAIASGPSGIADARTAIRDPQPFSRRGDLLAYQALLDEAERIRIELVALGSHRRRFVAAGEDPAPFGSLATEARRILEAVGEAVTRASTPEPVPQAVERLDEACSGIGRATSRLPGWVTDQAAASARALAGQLRSSLRIAGAMAGHPDVASFGDRPLPRRRPLVDTVRDSAVTLRANVSWGSTSFRHAVRLSVVLAAATAVDRYSPLPRGYWIPLTALVVLRPDFSSTTVRGFSRIAGTIAGAALATLLTALLKPGTAGLAVLFGLASFFAFLTVRANYAVFTVSVTSYVVFLLSFVRLPEITAVSDRIVDTLVGGSLAIAAYLLWPTWESRLVAPVMASLVEAQSVYSGVVLSCMADPSSPERRRLGEVRSAARLARTNAEASLARLSAEPEYAARSAAITPELAVGVMAGARRFVLGVLSLHAQLPADGEDGYPEVCPLASGLSEQLRRNAEALRGVAPSGSAEPALRSLHHSMSEGLRARLGELDNTAALLVAETDLMVDSTNTEAELLGLR